MTSTDLGEFGPAGAALARTVEADRLSPSYLFEGADAEVVREAAEAFAVAVLASDAPPEERARVARRVAQGVHPDLHVRGKDKATVISVAALTETLAAAHATPVAGRRQLFLIDPAEAMEMAGISRYLKALEEPPPGTVFVLVSTRPERLPPTVLSRVRRVRIPPPAPARIEERLRAEGQRAAQAASLARWASGSLSRARRMAATEAFEIATGLVTSATASAPDVAAGTDAVLSALRRAADARAEEAGTPKVEARREELRVLLGDLIHLLSVEAREPIAGRTSPLLGAVGADEGLRLLERLGALALAVRSNVTPAVVLLEAARILRELLPRTLPVEGGPPAPTVE